MTRKLIWERSHKNTMPDKSASIARYNEHIQEVKNTIPKEKLLIYSVDQGWKPLCGFLEVPVPNKPFPNVNDREQIKKTISKINRIVWLMAGTAGLIMAGVVYGLIVLLS